MSDDDTTGGIGRRRFLRLASTGLLAASVPAGGALADDSLPVRASGRRILRFVPDGDRFLRHERFTSPDLKRVYGKGAVSFDPEPVGRDHVPEEAKNPDRPYTVSYDDTGVFGTFDEHVNAEQRLRGPTGDADGEVGVDSHTPSYLGPFYAYKSADLAERSAPINVGWRRYLGLDAGETKSLMLDAGWGSFLPSSDRYALIYDGSSWTAEPQVNHIREPTGFTDQWHCRTWNVPFAMDDDYRVAAQAHHDPWDHGFIGSDHDWRFDDSRRTVLDTWDGISGYFTANLDVSNGSGFDSSTGLLGVVW